MDGMGLDILITNWLAGCLPSTEVHPQKFHNWPFSEANTPFVFQSSFFKKGYTPEDWHGTQKMKVWKMFFLFTWVILRFHVNLLGCMLQYRGFFVFVWTLAWFFKASLSIILLEGWNMWPQGYETFRAVKYLWNTELQQGNYSTHLGGIKQYTCIVWFRKDFPW